MRKSTFFILLGIMLAIICGGSLILYTSYGAKNFSHDGTPFYQKNTVETKTDFRSDLLEYPTSIVDADDSDAKAEGEDILNTRHLTTRVTSRFDLDAFAYGDFESLAGTWQDSNGYTLTITSDGSINDGKGTLTSYYDNVLLVTVEDTYSNFYLYVYPAETQINKSKFHLVEEDPSDYGSDRLVAIIDDSYYFDYNGVENFTQGVFHKISDSYPNKPSSSKESDDDEDTDEKNEDTNYDYDYDYNYDEDYYN